MDTCPHVADFDVDCVYKDRYDMCDDVEINSRNGDAWCFEKEETCTDPKDTK